MINLMDKIKIVFMCFLLLGMSACTIININEQSFLKDQKQIILYQLTLNGPQSKEELVNRTGYNEELIDKQLIRLNRNGSITQVQKMWKVTEKYVNANKEYVESIQKFNIEIEKNNYNHHTLSIFTVPKTSISAASFITQHATTTLIIFGGNGFNIVPDIQEVGKVMLADNRNVFVMNYPGMGDSSEETTIDSIENSASTFFNYVSNHSSTQGTNIVVYGFSLGGFVASDIASNNNLDGLILDSTAPDMQSWIDANVPFYAAPFVDINVSNSLAKMSNLQALETVKCPILFIGGKEDNITPVDMIPTLADASHTALSKTIVILDGIGHGETPDHSKFKSTISEFIQTLKFNNSILQ